MDNHDGDDDHSGYNTHEGGDDHGGDDDATVSDDVMDDYMDGTGFAHDNNLCHHDGEDGQGDDDGEDGEEDGDGEDAEDIDEHNATDNEEFKFFKLRCPF